MSDKRPVCDARCWRTINWLESLNPHLVGDFQYRFESIDQREIRSGFEESADDVGFVRAAEVDANAVLFEQFGVSGIDGFALINGNIGSET